MTTEDRAYGHVPTREYTPMAPIRPAFYKLSKERQMWYAARRLADYFSRTGDLRCAAKAKEIMQKWPVTY